MRYATQSILLSHPPTIIEGAFPICVVHSSVFIVILNEKRLLGIYTYNCYSYIQQSWTNMKQLPAKEKKENQI